MTNKVVVGVLLALLAAPLALSFVLVGSSPAPFNSFTDRDSATRKLAGDDPAMHNEAVVALFYKATRLTDEEIDALVDAVCAGCLSNQTTLGAARRVLILAGPRAERAMVDRLARDVGIQCEAGMQTLMDALIEIDQYYSGAFKADPESKMAQGVNQEELRRILSARGGR